MHCDLGKCIVKPTNSLLYLASLVSRTTILILATKPFQFHAFSTVHHNKRPQLHEHCFVKINP